MISVGKSSGLIHNPYQTRTKPVPNPYQPVLLLEIPDVLEYTSGFPNPYQTRTKPVLYPYQPVLFSRVWPSQNVVKISQI